MNYLAHTWLARRSDDALLGGLLGDFVHGQAALQDWPPEVRAEIILHRHIDRFTDTHPAVTAARADFGELRRYAGIVLDVHFDHLLARDWSRWNDMPLDAFTSRVYRVLDARHDQLPPRLQRIAPHMAADDWLGSYRQRDSVDGAIRGISTRLSRNGDKLRSCLPVLRAHEHEVEDAFNVFFPELITASETMRANIDAKPAAGH